MSDPANMGGMAIAAMAAVESGTDADAALRDLCGRLFAQPQRLAQTLTHRVTQRFVISPHAHDDVLQLDLIAGCTGRASLGGRWHAISGTTALVSYPGDEHGYELDPGAPPARVYHVKLRVERDWPIVSARTLPVMLTAMGRHESLLGALTVVMRLNVVRQVRSPLLFARLCEALALWPRNASADTEAGGSLGPREEMDLAPALRLIDARPAHPPSIEELAEAVSLSTRHLARRFRATFGCTPHTYITARRLDQSRKLLLEHRMKVHEIAEALGFSSVATFSRWFSQHFGVSPSQFREDPAML
jgi:AraC-like DNA-binding protein